MEEAPPNSQILSLRQRLYIVLEAGKTGDLASLIFDWVMVVLIIANVVAFSLETVSHIGAEYATAFNVLNNVSVLLFTIEYIARLWVCVEHPAFPTGTNGMTRLRFACDPYMIIDLLAILPFYLAFILPLDLRLLRVFRLLRFLKLARYSPALSSLGGTLKAERRALLGALIIMLGMLMMASTLMYYIERNAQPDVFGSIPQAMWWGLATLTTVGYGDAVPITSLGRLVGGVVMILGLGVFALPIGIIATGWAQEIHRREFVVTWGVVARVPLFAKLDAVSLAEIMALLRARVVSSGEVIVQRGERSGTMFFITTGRVEVSLHKGLAELTEGDFFGAVDLVRGWPSPVTIRALAKTHLLCIDAEDFKGLLARDVTLRAYIDEIAESRIAEGWGHPEETDDASDTPPEHLSPGLPPLPRSD